MLRLSGRKDKVTLVRNECQGCKIGSAEVPERLDALLQKAQALAEVRGRTLTTTEVLQEERFDTTDNP